MPADYGAFRVTASQFKDTTGAYAASLDPARTVTLRVGTTWSPARASAPRIWPNLPTRLPHVSHGSPPMLSGYLPAKNLVPALGTLHDRSGWAARERSADSRGCRGLRFRHRSRTGPLPYAAGEGHASHFFLSRRPTWPASNWPLFRNFRTSPLKRTGPLVAPLLADAADKPAGPASCLKQVNYQACVADERSRSAAGLESSLKLPGQMVLAIRQPGRCSPGLLLALGLAFGADADARATVWLLRC